MSDTSSRLSAEWQRLYANPASTIGVRADERAVVRALVLELGRPADWDRLGAVWRGVQTELGLPAPGIAASGTDGLQLWFSLVEPQPLAAAQDFLDGLRRRWLADLPAPRVTIWPQASDGGDTIDPPRPVPALNEATGNWSAYIAPDLAPLFADTPWLDIPPGDDGQAGLLGALASITPAAWGRACSILRAALQSTSQSTSQSTQQSSPQPALQTPQPSPSPPPVHLGSTAHTEPRAFLLAVMNDGSVPLPLRIEAARALLAG